MIIGFFHLLAYSFKINNLILFILDLSHLYQMEGDDSILFSVFFCLKVDDYLNYKKIEISHTQRVMELACFMYFNVVNSNKWLNDKG